LSLTRADPLLAPRQNALHQQAPPNNELSYSTFLRQSSAVSCSSLVTTDYPHPLPLLQTPPLYCTFCIHSYKLIALLPYHQLLPALILRNAYWTIQSIGQTLEDFRLLILGSHWSRSRYNLCIRQRFCFLYLFNRPSSRSRYSLYIRQSCCLLYLFNRPSSRSRYNLCIRQRCCLHYLFNRPSSRSRCNLCIRQRRCLLYLFIRKPTIRAPDDCRFCTISQLGFQQRDS